MHHLNDMCLICKLFTIFTGQGKTEKRITNSNTARRGQNTASEGTTSRTPLYATTSGSSTKSKESTRLDPPPPFTIEQRDLVLESWHYVEKHYQRVIKLTYICTRVFTLELCIDRNSGIIMFYVRIYLIFH